jgi:hypothetical protein
VAEEKGVTNFMRIIICVQTIHPSIIRLTHSIKTAETDSQEFFYVQLLI